MTTPYTFEVYDSANASHEGSLSKAAQIGWADDVRGPGGLVFSLPLSATADRALLPSGVPRVIRLNDGVDDVPAFVIRDEPAELVTDAGLPVVRYQCEQLLSILGYGRGGAVLYPFGGVAGLGQVPRWFGPMGWDFIERTGIPEPTTAGAPPTRENWPDPLAEKFVFDDRAVYRRLCTGAPEFAGEPSRMLLTTPAWTAVKVWLDGTELPALTTEVGDRTIRQFDLVYDGEDHRICFDGHGVPPAGDENGIVWLWTTVAADANGEYNDPDIDNPMFRTFNSTTFSGPVAPTAPFWQAWEDYADGDYPGVTVGFVAMVAIAEAQARGRIPNVTIDFDEEVDSAGVPWTHEFVHGFQPQRLGHLLEQLSAWGCEPTMTPDNVLRLFQRRGVDRGATPDMGVATVTLALPRSMSASGRGPVATRYLLATDGGFGEVANAAVEAVIGTELEDVLSLGEDVYPHTADEIVALQLASDSVVANELEARLPSTITPYVDVFPGDTIRAASDSDLTVADVRCMAFRCEVSDANGDASWTVSLELA